MVNIWLIYIYILSLWRCSSDCCLKTTGTLWDVLLSSIVIYCHLLSSIVNCSYQNYNPDDNYWNILKLFSKYYIYIYYSNIHNIHNIHDIQPSNIRNKPTPAVFASPASPPKNPCLRVATVTIPVTIATLNGWYPSYAWSELIHLRVKTREYCTFTCTKTFFGVQT